MGRTKSSSHRSSEKDSEKNRKLSARLKAFRTVGFGQLSKIVCTNELPKENVDIEWRGRFNKHWTDSHIRTAEAFATLCQGASITL